MDKEQLLYQYFSNSLTSEQKEQFNALLSSDAEFKEQFTFEQSLQKVIKNKEGKDLKDKLIDFEADIKQDTKSVFKLNYRKWAMAASIALLVGIGWLSFNNSFGTNYDDLYDANFQQYPNTVFAITRGDTVASLEREAFAAYETENYQAAINNFTKIPETDRRGYLDFFIAQSYLELNQTQKAKALFKKIIASNQNYVGETHWYLALTFLKEKNKEKAAYHLNELISKFPYNTEKAEELIQKLE